jgi:hypothetical protein
MINPAERHIGHEILEAQSRLTQKRFRSPLASGRSPFTRYEKALEEQQVFELIPSNLTAYVVMSDLGYNRMQRSVNSSQSLPQEAVLYMKQSVVTIHTLMNNLMSLNLLMRHPEPKFRYPFFQNKLNTDEEAFEELLKFTEPVAQALKKGVRDDELIDLVGIASYIYYHDANEVVDTDVESGIDVTLSTYRTIYPEAAHYLQTRSRDRLA